MMKRQWRLVYKNLNPFWVLFVFAQFSFLTTLRLPYLGEEAVYTITSLEMAFNHDWIAPTIFGINYARPPLLNWLIIPIANLLGWDQILIASRLVTMLSTLVTSLIVIWFTRKLFKNKQLSLLAALIYVSGDVLFRRGWLAYADPLFSLFVLGSLVSIWMVVEERCSSFLWPAMLCLIASFLTKALTGYLFYCVIVLVLCWRSRNRNQLLKPYSILMHVFAFSFPLVWNEFISEGAHGSAMVNDVLTKLNLENLSRYFVKVIFYPIDTWLRWLPVSALVLYFWLKAKSQSQFEIKDPHVRTLLWILVLNYIPYWLAPETHVRYIMPLYPFLAIIFACLLWQMGQEKIRIALLCLGAGIFLRYIVGIWVFPYYEQHYRGDYKAAAYEILTIVKDKPLYVDDHSATGLSVTAWLDIMRLPKPLLKRPEPSWQNGFMLSLIPEVANTSIRKEYRFGRQHLYLLCRGNACEI